MFENTRGRSPLLPSDTVGGNTTYFQNSFRWITLGGKMVISLTRGTKVICPLRVMVPLEDILKTARQQFTLAGGKNRQTNRQTDRQTNRQTEMQKNFFQNQIFVDSVVFIFQIF